MKFFAIVLLNNTISEHGYEKLIHSTRHSIERFNAIKPNEVTDLLEKLKLKWNYPFQSPIMDVNLNLLKTPYTTKEPKTRIACALSHYMLWVKCVKENEVLVILEHDAIFTKDIDFVIPQTYDILGINDPKNATRKSNLFHEIIQRSKNEFLPVPIIDDITIPQGLAGNSAYIIKPNGALQLLELVHKYGLWPNDAIMCQQLVKGMGVTKTYYTKVQGLKSTTS